eukprot:2443055-Amphidinium_carterae.1
MPPLLLRVDAQAQMSSRGLSAAQQRIAKLPPQHCGIGMPCLLELAPMVRAVTLHKAARLAHYLTELSHQEADELSGHSSGNLATKANVGCQTRRSQGPISTSQSSTCHVYFPKSSNARRVGPWHLPRYCFPNVWRRAQQIRRLAWQEADSG